MSKAEAVQLYKNEQNNPQVLCMVSLRITRADERHVDEWEVSQSEVS